MFDGAFVHVAGGGKGGFDYRFAMPTRHFSVLEDHIYPTDFFPFATVSARDPVTGAEGSILDRARALGAVPKLFYVNNSSEYWNRAASLIATDPAGERDLPPAPEARIYLIAGAQHYVGALSRARHLRQLRQHAQPLPCDARADAGVRALGPRRRRTAAEHLSAHRRRHAGHGRRPWQSLSRAFPSFVCPRATCVRRASTSAAGSRPIASPSRCRHAWANRSRRWCRSRMPTGWIRAASRCRRVLVPLGTRTGFNTRNEAAGFSGATGRLGRLVRAVRAHRGGAAGIRRSATVARRPLCQPCRI